MDDERNRRTGRLNSIAHQGWAIRTELALLALIIGTLVATCNLLLAIHRQADTTTRPLGPESTAATEHAHPRSAGEIRPSSPVSPKPAIVQNPPQPSEVLPPPEDPTKKVLAGLTKATANEVEAAQQADRRALALETARGASEAESRRWKRREMLVRQQISGLTARADQLESAASLLDAERDVLAKERDALKAALAKAGRRSGYSVLPYKGPTGTWRRPIVLECTSGSVKLQPKGLTFTAMDLSPLINPRSSPLVRAIAHEMLEIRASGTPDGAAAVPYLVFLVRPGGIRLYYQARSCLEPLGIAFGYELIEQDLVVDIPDFNNLATWDGSVPLDLPLEPAPRPKVNVAMNSPSEPGNGTPTGARGDQTASTRWPESPARDGQQSAGNSGNADTATPEDFVWPSRGRQNAATGSRSSMPSGSDGGGGQGGGGGLVAREGEAPSEPGQTSSSGGAFRGGNALGSSGSGLDPSGGAGSNIARGSGSGQSLSPGGARSSLSPGGGSGSSLSPGGGMGSSFSSGAGTGSNAPPSGGLGSSLSPGAGTGSSFSSGNGTGSSSTTGSVGGASLSTSRRPPGVSGAGADGTPTGSMNTLPDLEPAGDGSSLPPLTTPGLLPPGGRTGAESGAGGPYQNSGASQAGAGTVSAGGPGSMSSSPGGGGQSHGAAAVSSGSGSGGPGGARLDIDPAPIDGGAAGDNPGSPSAGGDLATQPYFGQQAGSAVGSQVSGSLGGSLATPSNTNTGGQPPVTLNVLGGLTSPSSALASAASSGFGTPSGSSSSSPSSSSSSGLGTPAGSGSSSSASSSSAMGGMPFGSPSSDSSSSSSSSSLSDKAGVRARNRLLRMTSNSLRHRSRSLGRGRSKFPMRSWWSAAATTCSCIRAAIG